MISDQELVRYWAKVERGVQDECWHWTAAKTPAGYGKQKLSWGFAYAHHIALFLDGRTRPAGAIALHSCDNPSCVNPRHLSWGTQKQNMAQAISRGRAPHEGRVAGEKNGNAVLTADQVLEIRTDRRTQPEIARDYGISRSLVSAVQRREAWRHVP